MDSSIQDYFDLDTAFSMDFHIRENPEDKSPSSPATTSAEETTFFVSEMPTATVAEPPAGGVCTVCMESFGPEDYSVGKRVPCGHVYHATCIAMWLCIHDSCPLCRCRISGHRESIPADYSD